MDHSPHDVTTLFKSKRLVILVLLFFDVVINYVHRINLSVAGPFIAEHFHWDAARMGILYSASVWTYSIALIPCGWLADRIGARRVNSLSVTIWSLGAIVTGAVTGFSSLVAARLVLGAGEASSYPVAGKVVRQWFPTRERGFASSFYNAGAYAGPALALPLSAWLTIRIGWRMSFVVLGALGFIWLYYWNRLYQSPEECTWLSQHEREYIVRNRDDHPQMPSEEASSTSVSLKHLLTQKTVWGLAISEGCGVYSQYLFLTWLPSYLVQARGMELTKAAMFSAVPFVAAATVGVLVGRVSDRMLEKRAKVPGRRRTAVIVLMLLSSISALTTVVNSEWAALAIMTVSVTSLASCLSLNLALTSDLLTDSRIAGSVYGIQILGGNLFGIIAPIVTGYIVKATGRFDSAFGVAGVLLLVGGLVSLLMNRKPITAGRKDGRTVGCVLTV